MKQGRGACRRLDIYRGAKLLPHSTRGCAQPHKETCRFAAAAGAILTADLIDREYRNKKKRPCGRGKKEGG